MEMTISNGDSSPNVFGLPCLFYIPHILTLLQSCYYLYVPLMLPEED